MALTFVDLKKFLILYEFSTYWQHRFTGIPLSPLHAKIKQILNVIINFIFLENFTGSTLAMLPVISLLGLVDQVTGPLFALKEGKSSNFKRVLVNSGSSF